ncbi:MAG: hypothetical protein GF347_02670 [Candidatus Moranbacteria bacterium]|nr:hypothetical protein [Candidatus Moranbacteria bacterium]
MPRLLKQIIILLIFLFIFAGISYWIYGMFIKPSCEDGKRNQNETGIDCGGVCPKECPKKVELKQIEVQEADLVEDASRYDVFGKIFNSNSGYGVQVLKYEFVLYDESGKVGSRSGETYILPKEEKYIVETGINVTSNPTKVELELEELEESDFVKFEESEYPKIETLNQSYAYAKEAGRFFEINFQVVNRSSYNLHTLHLVSVVKDENGELIALNKGNINDVTPGEVRDFRFLWPREIPVREEIEIDLEASSNVLDFDNIY